MKIPNSGRPGRTRLFGVLVAGGVLLGPLSSSVASAPAEKPKPKASAAPSTASATRPVIAKSRSAWRAALSKLPQAKEGCYVSSFPRVEWKPVPCGPPPSYPMPPSRGVARHFVVGGANNDFEAHVTGTMSAVEGTFPTISAGLTESGPIANSGPSIADAYTLQINSNFFASTACAGSPNANCQGWEQFVYENNNVSHRVFIQYWLIKYNDPCPAGGWTQFVFNGGTDIYCYQSTTTASLPAGVPVGSFDSVTFSASANAGGDQVVISDGTNAAMRAGTNAVALSTGWTDAEFNVFGDGGNNDGGGQAAFGNNSTIVVKTTVHNGTRNAPTCVTDSFTDETNNLTLVGMNAIMIQPAPAIEFTESNVPGTAAACQTAAGTGDTHLSTFNGLLYDFQASGDFVLAETDQDFEVQARQVSGAPTWPSASVNKAVATRMGKTRVAVCTEPSRLAVDGVATDVQDGQTLSLPSGVDIRRIGNVYTVIGQHGDSMRAEDNGAYINVSVGLGRWPANVRGVLANVKGQVNKIAARTGTVLTAPFPFTTLYHEFADSWRVPAKDSLLAPCGESTETGIPKQPFYATDLDPQVYRRARQVCVAAGVKVQTLLEACALDVAVIGREEAAKVFATLRPPKLVGRVVAGRGSRGVSRK